MTANQKATLASIGVVVAFIALFFIPPQILMWLLLTAVALLVLLLAGMGVREIWYGFRRMFE